MLKVKSPFLGPTRANLFLFLHIQRVETLCKAFNHHNNLNYASMYTGFFQLRRDGRQLQSSSPFCVCIPCSTARAELVRKKNPNIKSEKSKKGHTVNVFFNVILCSLDL